MKYNWFVVLVFLGIQFINGQLLNYTFQEIDSLKATNPKPILVFLHTDWCKPCAVMKKKTFTNKNVINTLNNEYYFVSFDAEIKENVKFKGRNFRYKPSSKRNRIGIHELALRLGKYNNRLSFPTITILDTKSDIIFQYPSVLKPKGFLRLLKAIKENEEF